MQIASGSCNLYTRRDLISHSPLTNPSLKPSIQQRKPTNDLVQIIDQIEYYVMKLSLPALEVDVHYTSKYDSVTQTGLNKRGSLYCRTIIQSPSSQLNIRPIILNFLEQTLEHAHLRNTRHHQSSKQETVVTIDPISNDNDHLDTMYVIVILVKVFHLSLSLCIRFSIEDQNVVASFPIDVVVSVFIQPCVLLFDCLPSHPMECELRLPAVDIVLSSKRAIPSTNDESSPPDDNALGGISFSLYMKDFKLNVYHPFLGESKVHQYEDIHSNKLQTRNALAVSVQSVSINISRIRTLLIDPDGVVSHSIHLSVLAQISRGQFEYDIRRFSEDSDVSKDLVQSGVSSSSFSW